MVAVGAHTDQSDELVALFGNAAKIIDTAGCLDPTPAGRASHPTSWHGTLEAPRRVLAVERTEPHLEHDLGLEL